MLLPRTGRTGTISSRELHSPRPTCRRVCTIASAISVSLLPKRINLLGRGARRSYLGDAEENGTYFKRKMDRHLIPVHDDSGVWHRDFKRGFTGFVRERTNLICQELEAEAGILLFRREAQ